MNTQHTPGPWTLNPAKSNRVDLIDNHKGEAVGEIVFVDVRNPADARLIAMAPAMLQALQRITHPAADDDDLEHALEVIAQATGVQP